jgi:hypothetical protein
MLHTGGIDGVAQAYIVGLGHVTRGVKVSTSNNYMCDYHIQQLAIVVGLKTLTEQGVPFEIRIFQ